jgi:hypothetical protein
MEPSKREELASLFGLSAADLEDITASMDEKAEKAKEEEEAFFL